MLSQLRCYQLLIGYYILFKPHGKHQGKALVITKDKGVRVYPYKQSSNHKKNSKIRSKELQIYKTVENKMAKVSSYLSITTLNVHGLNSQSKDKEWLNE